MNESECACLADATHSGAFDKEPIGVDDNYGEVAVWTCRRCGRRWLHYFVEYEYLTASGRFFSGVIPADVGAIANAHDALSVFDKMDWYFRGGSAFAGKVVRTKGPLTPWLTPFPGQ